MAPGTARRRIRWGVIAAVVVVVALAVGAGAVAYVRTRPPEPSVGAFCDRMVEAQDLDTSMATLDPAAIDGQVGALRSAAQVAPAEVAAPVAVVLGLAEVIAEVVADNPTQATEAVTEALRQRRHELPAVTDAGRVVEAYTEANCGLQLSPPATTTG